MAKHLIGLVGLIGCGKGTVAEILQREYNADYVRFSAILSRVLDALFLEKNRPNLSKMSQILREGFGEDILSYAIEKQSLSSTKDIVVIDGIRRLEDIVAFETLPQFHLIAIDVSAETRFHRIKHRGEKIGEQDLTWEQFLAQDRHPADITIPDVMKRADITLKNEGTTEELERSVRAYMDSLV